MVSLAVREFQCALCQQQFTLLSDDLIVPESKICDECLRVTWAMDDQVLAAHVRGCLARAELLAGGRPGSPGEGEALVNDIVQSIKQYREQWGEVERALEHREQGRRAFG